MIPPHPFPDEAPRTTASGQALRRRGGDPPTPDLPVTPRAGNPILLSLVAVLQALLLGACGSSPLVKELTRPFADSPLLGTILNPDKLSEESRAFLDEEGLTKTFRSDPDSALESLHNRLRRDSPFSHRIAIAELCSDAADASATARDPRKAMGYFLAAAEVAAEAIDDAGGGREHREELIALYNHSSGRFAELFVKSGQRASGILAIDGPWRRYRVACRGEEPGVIDPGFLDSLKSADYLEFKNIDLPRIRTKGIGAAMVGYRKATVERRQESPRLHPVGMALPVNATLGFSEEGEEVELVLRDLLVSDQARLAGRMRPLAADFTAPLALLYNHRLEKNVGLKGMLRPETYLDRMGLYQLEPFRPDKTPVVLVHGLKSSPEAWAPAINLLQADPVLRRRYQFLFFHYPTGFPIVHNAAALRHHLHAFSMAVDPAHRNPRMRNMVLVGHSMGGILSSTQIRGSGDTFTKAMLTRPIDDLRGVSKQEKETLRKLLVYEANPDIARAVFIATPHRGSNIARGPIGAIGSKLIRLPMEVLTIQSLQFSPDITPLGREIITRRPDSIKGLKPNGPGLSSILKQSVRPGTRYHSIIGRKNPADPLEESSDGVVPYWSAHLDGAASERIIHGDHGIVVHPEAIEEVRRILYLHAGQP